MKWIEIVTPDGYKRIYNINMIQAIARKINTIIRIFFENDKSMDIILSSSAEADIQYDLIKAFCENYGPIPSSLTIESL